MTLATAVWPGVFNTMAALVDNPPLPDVHYPASWGTMPALQGISEGEQLAIPSSPWCWLQNDSGDLEQARRGGADREASDYTIMVTVVYDATNKPDFVEHVLMALEAQVRAAFRAHIKLGFPASIAQGLPGREGWGYMPINGIMHRTVQLFVVVTEKVSVTLGA